MSYLVPVDAPSFHKNPQMVKRMSLSMSRVRAWCREMEARQAMFIFDCRLAPIGLTQQPAESPFAITERSAEPVRYFIFAGENSETPSVARTFSPALLSGLAGKADLNQDGYITGAELGHFTEVAMQPKTPWVGPFTAKPMTWPSRVILSSPWLIQAARRKKTQNGSNASERGRSPV